MRYVELVAKTGQVNSPPGSYDTIKNWIREGLITSESRVLEIGCNTGFISYNINQMTGAVVHGIDLSEFAVEKARSNCNGLEGLTFDIGDAGSIESEDGQYSHVIIGGHLPFAPGELRENHVEEALRVLKNNGCLLSTLFYWKTKPGRDFLIRLNSAFDLQLTGKEDYDYWSGLFQRPDIVLEWEKCFEVFPADAKRRAAYLARFGGEDRLKWEPRVDLFAENAKFVEFFVKIMRKVNPDDPFLQIPRGGIYTWKEV